MTRTTKKDEGGYKKLSWESNPGVLKTGGKNLEKWPKLPWEKGAKKR